MWYGRPGSPLIAFRKKAWMSSGLSAAGLQAGTGLYVGGSRTKTCCAVGDGIGCREVEGEGALSSISDVRIEFEEA
jgi:hypothetical protein